MRDIRDNTGLPNNTESADYLRGYRDGLKDRMALSRRRSGTGILGAVIAILVLAGLGYLLYNYSTTGRLLPNNIEITPSRPVAP
ncbi:hypothetical protein [Leptolyngbya sp. NIES-2104]|uniref:hypothetical protein n=1 Tax=Leptolyngbya sp. NIES-2104 TaxID=1552121 RepID=UPI0006EC4967|nr:hypothetical protein [Leptolyngbya sp. NIES-2104]GAP96937.1 hypothetical protein NIES2104_34840 [Leptolyngbya sp. NIES-2104]